MGQATVVDNLGNGLYLVDEEIDVARITARIEELQATSQTLTTDIVATEASIQETEAALISATAAIDTALDAGVGPEELQEAVNATITIRSLLDQDRLKLARLELQLASENKVITSLTSYLATPRTKNAWCADLTTNIPTGASVGTIDPGRQTRPTLILKPGKNAESWRYNGALDGVFSPLAIQSPFTFGYNVVAEPLANRFRARYRVGTITALDTSSDRAEVVVDDVSRTIVGINPGNVFPNNAQTLENVPIDYLTCNATAFEVGHRVVVQFDEQGDDPIVVGFEFGPQPCGGGLCGGGLVLTTRNVRAFPVMDLTFDSAGTEFWRWNSTEPFGETIGFRVSFQFNSSPTFAFDFENTVQDLAAYPFPFETGLVRFITANMPTNEDFSSPIRVAVDRTSNTGGTVLVAGFSPGGPEPNISIFFGFTRPPDVNTGPSFLLPEFVPFSVSGNQFGFETESLGQRFTCSPAIGYVEASERRSVPSLFLSTCFGTPSSYNWSQPVQYDEIRFKLDGFVTSTGRLRLTGNVSGRIVEFIVNGSCQQSTVLTDTARGMLVFFDQFFFEATILTNFSSPPDQITGESPPWFDPSSSPVNYGFELDEPVSGMFF